MSGMGEFIVGMLTAMVDHYLEQSLRVQIRVAQAHQMKSAYGRRLSE